MNLSSVIRGAGKAASSVGRAVQSASQKLEPAPQHPAVTGTVPGTGVTSIPPGPPAAMPGSVPPGATPASAGPAPGPAIGPPAPAGTPGQVPTSAPKGFQLPDLGAPPDQSAPEYQGEGGAQRYADAAAEYQHKQDIHKAFQDLDAIYTQAHPNRDFQAEYQQSLAEQKQHEADRPKANGLARAALALGDFNPAVVKSGRSNLDTYNENLAEKQKLSDTSFSQRQALRLKMHQDAADQAQQEGNWKKALAEQEKAALLESDTKSLQHQRDMEKLQEQQAGMNTRAQMRRDAIEQSARIRANTIGAAHGLSGNFETQFEKEAAKAVAKFLGPRDLTKEYTPSDLESMSTYIEHLAEMFHDQQNGTNDGGAKHFATAPSKRTPPKPQTKEQF